MHSFNYSQYMPILRPLSDLTKDHAQNCGYTNLDDFTHDIIYKKIVIKYWMDLLNNHYDVFGLIDAGLAIDMNTLK